MVVEARHGQQTAIGEMPVADAVWRCTECHGICGVVKYAGRVGVIRFVHCPACGSTTKQVVQSIEELSRSSGIAAQG